MTAAAHAAWREFGQIVKGFLLLVLACAASMAIGFFVFNRLASQVLPPPVHEESMIEEARALRQHANALVLLMSDFLNASRGDPIRFEVWLDEVYRPGVARAQRAMRTQRHEGPAQSDLLAAANLLAALGERPDERDRRDEAVRTVLAAAGAAEERIGDLGVAPFLDEPAQLLQFRLMGQ